MSQSNAYIAVTLALNLMDIVQQAMAQGRDVTKEELDASFAKDDEAREELVRQIEARRQREQSEGGKSPDTPPIDTSKVI